MKVAAEFYENQAYMTNFWKNSYNKII